MSRLILNAVGDIDGITLEENPDLTLGADDVLVAVEAATVNPADFLLAQGWYGYYPEALPYGLGSEGVGRVAEAGSPAHQGLVGKRVIILPTYEQGTWADRAVVPARNTVVVPDGADAVQLAMLPINPATAYALLNHYVPVRRGDWIGQNLGNSAVGQYVVKLAKLAGVKTVSVVRREEAVAGLKALGADVVLVDGENLAGRVAEALGDAKLKLVLDGAGDATAGELVQALEFRGTVVTYSSQTGDVARLPIGNFVYGEIQHRGMWLINWVRNAPRDEIERTYAHLADLVAKGELTAAVEASYPLEKYQDAFAHAQRPGRSGKIVFQF
jgi:NADPH:quinone reductase-like Zn-dependent oxidoreductase